jgi:hypothetical protein
MRTILLLGFLATTALAQDAPVINFDFSQANRGGSIGLDCRDAGGGTSARAATRKLEVNLGNSGRQPYNGTLDVLWIGKDKQGRQFLFHREATAAAVPASFRDKKILEMPPLKYYDFSGWAVILRDGEKIQRLQASSQSISDFLKTPTFTKSLEEFEGKRRSEERIRQWRLDNGVATAPQ